MLDGLAPGERLPRPELHERYGGRPQSAISPSSRANVVMLFTAPLSSPSEEDYLWGLGDDGFLHYAGEGQSGDQRFTQGNKAILNHQQDGRTLEGFLTDRSGATYLGEFEYVSFYRVDAPDLANPHLLRQVIVFRLKPVGVIPVPLPPAPFSPTAAPRILDAAPPRLDGSRTHRRSSRADRADLVKGYMRHLERAGHEVRQLRILPPGEAQPFSPDFWDQTTRELVEVRTQVTRDQVRNAIGTLLDCSRFVDAASLALLVPTRPRPDLLALLNQVGVAAIYEDETGWIRIDPTSTDVAGRGSLGSAPGQGENGDTP